MEGQNQDDRLPESAHLRINHRDQAHAAGRIKWAVGQGYLDIDEAEQRLEAIYRAGTHGELQAAVRDLPGDRPPPPGSVGGPVRSGSTAVGNRVVAILGSAKRDGGFDLNQAITVVAVLGDVSIDLSTAVVPASGIDIEIRCALGDTKVILPDGVRVEQSGFAVLGERTDKISEVPADGPVVRIDSSVLLGSFTVYSLSRTPKKVLARAWKRLTGS